MRRHAEGTSAMPDLDLDAIERRTTEADGGVWRVARKATRDAGEESPDGDWVDVWTSYDDTEQTTFGIANDLTDANAEFIAHARSDIPALIAEVRRLQERPDLSRVIGYRVTMPVGWTVMYHASDVELVFLNEDSDAEDPQA
jgi:hypothetical protein